MRKSTIVTLATLFLLLAGNRAALAADGEYGDFEHYFHVDKLEIGPVQCIAEATIDFDGVQSHMSSIRDQWLSAEKSLEFYQRDTLKVIYGVIDHKAGGLMLQVVYDQGRSMKPDKCRFILNLTKIDEFGQSKSYRQLSWDFNTRLASKIVWDKFDDRNLSKIVLNYKFTGDAERLLREQNGQVALPSPSTLDRPKSCDDILAVDVAEAFNNSPYAQGRHLKVLDATNPTSLPQRANRGFACISRLVTNGGTMSVFIEPKLLNGKWYVSVDRIPQ